MTENNNRYDMLNTDDREEALRIKKMRQGLIPDTENEKYQKEKEEKQPLTFKQKIANIWYHSKWMILGGLFFGTAIIVLTIQAFYAETYDTTLLICSDKYYFSNETIDTVENRFAKYMDDVDGDGKVIVSAFQASYNEIYEADRYTGHENAMQARIMAEIANGENCLFVIEKEIFDIMLQRGVFLDLRETLGIKSDEKVFGIDVTASELLTDAKVGDSGNTYYMAIRVKKDDTDQKQYDAQLKALKRIYEQTQK